MSTQSIKPLVEQLELMVLSVSADNNIDNAGLRRVLRFVSKVVQVVNQAFQNIYPLLIEIQFLKPEDLNSGKIDDLRKELMLLTSRDYFRDIELICGQLRELSDQYQNHIEPIINNLDVNTQGHFGEVFALLNEHEGYILRLVWDVANELDQLLASATDIASLNEARMKAAFEAKEMKRSLHELQLISNKILGLSGKDGFLELTETDRLQIRDEINYSFNFIDRSVTAGNITGSHIAVGSDIQMSYQDDHSTGMDAAQVMQLIDGLITDLRKEGLPPETEQKVVKQLEVAEDELKEKNPDKEYIGKNIEKVTKTLKNSGAFIDAASSIGQKLLAIGKWVGIAIALL